MCGEARGYRLQIVDIECKLTTVKYLPDLHPIMGI